LSTAAGRSAEAAGGGRRLLPRAQRREQILAAATRAFARAGFSATNLDDIAAEAGVGRVILYRHFDSKAELYRAVLRRAEERLTAVTGSPEFTDRSLDSLLAAAAADPPAFHLLFHHAAREPEFSREMDELRAKMFAVTHRYMAELVPDPTWARWASLLLPTFAVEAVIAWLDAGQPDQSSAARRIGDAVLAIIEAARSQDGGEPPAPALCP
jgi:AcrR family transcriptional regulator